MSMELSNYFVTWVVNLIRGLTTYVYRGYNLFTKFHGHPSTVAGKIGKNGGCFFPSKSPPDSPRSAGSSPVLLMVQKLRQENHLGWCHQTRHK